MCKALLLFLNASSSGIDVSTAYCDFFIDSILIRVTAYYVYVHRLIFYSHVSDLISLHDSGEEK